MTTAFQSDAFQTNAFQIDSGICTTAFQIDAFQSDAFQTCVVAQATAPREEVSNTAAGVISGRRRDGQYTGPAFRRSMADLYRPLPELPPQPQEQPEQISERKAVPQLQAISPLPIIMKLGEQPIMIGSKTPIVLQTDSEDEEAAIIAILLSQ